MSGCPHPAPIPHAVCYTLVNGGAGGGTIWAVHLQVFCPACSTRFRFVGNMAPVPETAGQAMLDRRGAWVSVGADEMGVLVEPDTVPGEDLGAMQTMGSA